MLLDDCLYHPLPLMTFLRPLNRALQSIYLPRRRNILTVVAKLATIAVISCKNQSRLTEVDWEACIWIKQMVTSRNFA